MHSLAARIEMVSLVVWTAVREVENRLRALWIWRHGRERAAMRGVIHC